MEITASALQTVAVNQNVLFTETPIDGNCSILHRAGSGLVTIRGITNQCRARFRISFGANIASPAGTDPVEPVVLALAINGEPVATAAMVSTPAAAGDYNNVYSSVFVNVPSGCCTQISVANAGTTPVDVQGANLIVERVA